MRLRSALPVPAALALVAGGFALGPSTAQAATAPPAFGYGTPTFANSAAPAYNGSTFFQSDSAGEPSIGVDWKTGKAMFQAATDTYQLSLDTTTTSPKVTWKDVTSPFLPFSLDPILATDPTTGITLAGADNGACGGMSRSTDDGETWTPTEPCTGTIDHPTVGFGPATGPLAAAATGPIAYYCQQEALLDQCTHSLDGGQTWTPTVADTSLTCDYLFGHLKAATDGTAYIPNNNCFDEAGDPTVGGLVTTDGGTTLSHYLIPGQQTPARGFDPSVAVTPDGTLYQSWERDGDYHPVVSISHDKGQTWTAPLDLATSAGIKSASFAAAVAGDNGRVAIAYLGSRVGDDSLTPYDPGYDGVFYLFVSYTYDGGQSWQTFQATPDPVQRGSIDDGGLNPTDPSASKTQRNLLDFIDAQLTKDGRVVVAYADGCIGSCNGSSGTVSQSTHQWATVAVQGTGRGLFSAYDVTPVTAPSAPTLSVAGGSTPALSWTAPADGGSTITSYQVSRSTSPGAEQVVATIPADVTSWTDTSAVGGTTYYYTVAAVNAIGVGDPSNEVSATPATAPAAPTLSASDGNAAAALSWTTPADGGAAITGYTIYRGLAAGTATRYATVGAVTSYADTAVTPGTTYYYRVAATNAAGTGAPSGEASATPTTVPGAPTLTGSAGKGQVALSWTTPSSGFAPITGYAIYRGISPGGETLIQTISSGTSYVDNTVTGGTTYYYRVAAQNRNGTGAPSNEVAATAKKAGR